MKKVLTVAQIGCGYWGPNLLRNYSSLANCRVKYLAELREERRKYVESNFPKTTPIPDYETALHDPEVDAVIIATAASTHFDLARQALEAGKHVFVEKPLSMSVKDATRLGEMAEGKMLTLMVGHTFLYNAAVNYLKQLVTGGELGTVFYAYMQRLNLGVIRSDVNVMWNLAPHDISIICYVLAMTPIAVSAIGHAYVQPGIEDVVFMNLMFSDNMHVHIHVSWLDPHKIRRATLVGQKKMVLYDDVSDDKITIYDKGIDVKNSQTPMPFDAIVPYTLTQRAGDIHIPKIDFQEPLKTEAKHFVDCVLTSKRPLSDARNGREVVAILEAAQESLKHGGRQVSLA